MKGDNHDYARSQSRPPGGRTIWRQCAGRTAQALPRGVQFAPGQAPCREVGVCALPTSLHRPACMRLLQGVVLALICTVLGVAAPDEALIPACASIAAELAALTLLPFCNRAARYGMREIEAAARFNSAHIMLARLVAVGIGDAVCISAIALLLGGAAYEVLVFVATPFLLTAALSLAVLEHAGESAVMIAAGMGAVLAAAYWMLAERFTKGLLHISPLLAATICLAALAALMCECRAMLSEKKLEKELGYES